MSDLLKMLEAEKAEIEAKWALLKAEFDELSKQRAGIDQRMSFLQKEGDHLDGAHGQVIKLIEKSTPPPEPPAPPEAPKES